MSLPAPFRLAYAPRKLLLFSGHITDAPDRTQPRFPAALVPAAAQRIAATIGSLHADESDIALTQGAAGGDLLFVEACMARQVPVQLLQPLPEDEFIASSIVATTDGEQWRRRYLAARAALPWPPRSLPAEAADDPFEACNQWLLSTALASGAGELHLICLWNGDAGDGPGGTAHMVDEMRRHGGRVSWIDTRTL
jgi:hypothetical protein